MKDNALLFSLYHHVGSNGEYISMLHYSLKTLHEVMSNSNFDIVVFLCSNKKDFSFDFNHLDKFNIVKDYPNVKIFYSDYNSKDAYMAKWYHFEKTFELGYKKVFYFDCDTIFLQDPSFLFTKYTDESFWCLFEGLHSKTEKLLGHAGINSGHFLMHKDLFRKIPKFFESVLKTRTDLNVKAERYLNKNVITGSEYEEFLYFSEQYCAQVLLLSLDIPIKELSYKELSWGGESGTVIRDDNENPTYKNTPSVVWHYTTGDAHRVLPLEYHTPFHNLRYKSDKLKEYKDGLFLLKEKNPGSVENSPFGALYGDWRESASSSSSTTNQTGNIITTTTTTTSTLNTDNDALKMYKLKKAKSKEI